ncbi:TIGR04140 family protein [Thermococcus sp.]|uniref:TIGR04140 family protein n=1 Tax=Thermococcus sp. TaxID=35749 RepID=UPI00260D6A79|nr:TIGR04140 family protein [Thermococcus sp.]
MRIIETPIPLRELNEIREKSGADVELVFLEKVERNGIPLNVVLIRGAIPEIERFMEKLMVARAGG